MLIVESGSPKERQARVLLEQSHQMMQDLFPPEENYHLSLDDLVAPNVHFYIARDGVQVCGTGALVVKSGYGEVKSMFTSPAARGRGVASAILRQIEDQAKEVGLDLLRLETADILASAVRLYEGFGFSRCGAFGDYVPNNSSVFMEKSLVG